MSLRTWFSATRACGWLLLLCLLPACSSTGPARAPVGDRTERPVRIPEVHYVRTGDTLYSIAFQYGRSVEELAQWNRLRKPYTIYQGQRLRLHPLPATASAPKPRPVQRPVVTPSQPKVSRGAIAKPGRVIPNPRASQPKTGTGPTTAKAKAPRAAPKTVTREKPASRAKSGKPRWSWPVKGRLISGYNPSSAGRKGINIAGRAGDPVRAAAAGKVVYSGSGLSGYGRLIIVKHNKDFLSAYAHNRKLIAKEGQWVKQGEVIALMGSSGTDRTMLHFEIRKRGRPVNPLHYLPKR